MRQNSDPRGHSQRNAVRLNGTNTTATSSAGPSPTSGAPSPSGSSAGGSSTGDATHQQVVWTFAAVAPIVVAALTL